MIPWICPHCSKEFPVIALAIARNVPCPHCGMSVDIPALIKLPTQSRNAVGALSVLFKIAINNFAWCDSLRTFSILVGFVGWIATIQTPPSPFILVHYALLVLVLVGIYLVFVNTWSAYKKAIKIAGFVFGLSIVSLYATKYDSFKSRWTDKDGDKFIDTYKRWGHDLVYRSVIFKDDSGFCHGPMKGEGHPKQHGKWTCLGKWFRDGLEYTFYWYGEEVSEGEWNLRNK